MYINYTTIKLFEGKQTLCQVFIKMKTQLWPSAVTLGTSGACFSAAFTTSWIWASVMFYYYTTQTLGVESILVFP